jgi:uncharacterized protein (DUF1800 family)
MPKRELNFPGWSIPASITALLAVIFTVGCGGGLPGSTPVKPESKVLITPASSSLRVGAKVKFAATVPGSTNSTVLWSVNGIPGGNSTLGTVDKTGLYQAPNKIPTGAVSVVATSVADVMQKAEAAITVQNPVPGLTSVTPASLTVGSFNLSVAGSGFVPGAVVVWGGTFLPTTFVSDKVLHATGSDSTVGDVKIAVVNPHPGSASSGEVLVHVGAVLPNLISAQVAARFLEQSSWGPTSTSIALVRQQGIEGAINQQLALPASTFPAPGANDGMDVIQAQLFLNAQTKPDQLRQRVAFALSEIMVASANKVNNPSAFVLWQNMFQKDAFGNFLALLTDVTVSPTMGNYLDMVNNDKPDPVAGTSPNENYAREAMQLFSIGLNELNPDGTLQLDGSGNPVPTYTQDTVEGFAHVYTGWTYPTKPGATGHFRNPEYYGGPMIAVDSHHDAGSKLLLNGTTLPAGGTAQADLTAAMQNIFQHPNVGPFIGKQLIQHLVTSNPSPDYIGRITAVFNDDGKGVRGDLAAVVKAILLDPEARHGDDPAQAGPTDGKLKEPMQFILNTIVELNGTGNGDCLAGYANTMKQQPFFSPSVFNFFHPDHVISGGTLLGPEFEILDAGTTINRINFVNTMINGTPCGSTRVNLDPYIALAADPAKLVDGIAAVMLHGNISDDMRNALITNVSTITDLTKRTKTALYLIASSSQYQVQH